ncbi:MAG: DUF3592 domain-containing protein [Pseudomonadota bacterium]
MNHYSLKKVQPRKIRIVKWVFTIVGAAFFLIGCHQLYGTYHFTNVALPAEGTVQSVERKETRDSEGHRKITYRPTMTYRDAFGVERTARTYLSSSGYNYDIGARVAVLYDPDEPTVVRVDGFVSLWVFGAIFAGLGALFLIIGLFLKPSMGDQSGDDGDQPPPEPKRKRWNNTVRRR